MIDPQSHSEFVCQSEYSDDDSDCTEEETLVMLNFPQLNFDEGKLKMLSVIRKRETNEATTINEDIKRADKGTNELSEEERRKKKIPRKEQPMDIFNSENSRTNTLNLKCTVKEKSEKEQAGKELKGTKTQKEEEKEKEKERERKKEKKKEQQELEQEDKGEQKQEQRNNKDETENREKGDDIEKKKEKGKEKKVRLEVGAGTKAEAEVGEFPIKIESISMENIFSVAPKCILNNKYEFTGIQTSSIGTNLFFKEPLSMKQDSDLKNENITYEGVFKKEMKNESIMTREDFAIYEGHSTKIISFEIDY